MFEYTTDEGTTLQFLNMRIIQTQEGISFDQTQHIENKILPTYFDKDDNVPYVSHPFPVTNTFKNDLYKAFPLTGDALVKLTEKHKGTLAHWVGELIHITTY